MLLVNDELNSEALYGERLETQGFVIFHYMFGQEVINDVRDGTLVYYIGLIDLSLPDVDGMQVIEYLKSVYPTVPLISCSAYLQFGFHKSPLVDGTLAMPFGWEIMTSVINRHLPGAIKIA